MHSLSLLIGKGFRDDGGIDWNIPLTYSKSVFSKAAAERFPRWSAAWGYFLLFVSLLVAGAWHGSFGGFLVFGMLHGLGVALWKAYGDTLKLLLPRPT
jgi:D-alanyl-lipoteichoic acid acyltransferase DltB (MBOAT superfamily)